MAGTRDLILTAAAKMIRATGSQSLTMRSVAAELGISATALYRHFHSKDDLLDAVADHGFVEMAVAFRRARQQGSAREQVLATFVAMRTFAVRKPRLFDLMYFAPRAGAHKYPSDYARGASPSGAVVIDLLQEMRVRDPLVVAMMLWAEAEGLVALYRAGRFDSERAFVRAWDAAFARLVDAI